MPGEESFRRYASAEAMAGDLRRWLDGRPISARPVSPLEKVWRCCRRRPAVAALTAALSLVLSIGFLVVTLLWRRAEAERKHAEDDLHFAGLMLSEITSIGHPGSPGIAGLARDNVIEVLEAQEPTFSSSEPNVPMIRRHAINWPSSTSTWLQSLRTRSDSTGLAPCSRSAWKTWIDRSGGIPRIKRPHTAGSTPTGRSA